MRHLAWLNTAPKSKAKTPPKTRGKAITDDGGTPSFPPLSLGGYLVEYLFDAGPTMAGGMGVVPLSHSEINAWQANTGIELSAWEARTLRDLSAHYLAMSQEAESAQCKPPFAQSADSQKLVAIEMHSKLDLFLS